MIRFERLYPIWLVITRTNKNEYIKFVRPILIISDWFSQLKYNTDDKMFSKSQNDQIIFMHDGMQCVLLQVMHGSISFVAKYCLRHHKWS